MLSSLVKQNPSCQKKKTLLIGTYWNILELDKMSNFRPAPVVQPLQQPPMEIWAGPVARSRTGKGFDRQSLGGWLGWKWGQDLYLVAGWATPLKNMSSSIGTISNPILMGKCQKWQPNHQPDIIWHQIWVISAWVKFGQLLAKLGQVVTWPFL